MGDDMNNSQCERRRLSHPEESLPELINRLSNERRNSNGNHSIRLLSPISINSISLESNIIDQVVAASTCGLPAVSLFKNPNDFATCSCTNCINRRSVLELVNKFENQKVHMITELEELKSETDLLETQSSELDSHIAAYAESVDANCNFLKELQEDSSSIVRNVSKHPHTDAFIIQKPEETIQSINEQNAGAGDCCPKQAWPTQSFQYDIKTLQMYSSAVSKKMMSKSDIRSSSSPPSSMEHVQQPTSSQVLNVKDMKDIKSGTEAALQRALEDNLYMVGQLKHLETTVRTLLGSNPLVIADEQDQSNEMDLELVNAMERDPTLCQLNFMKNVYDTNLNLIDAQCEKLRIQSQLISKYEDFVGAMYNSIGNILPSPTSSENQDVSQTLYHLWSCLRQVLTDNDLMFGKLEALQQNMFSVIRENSLLNETVSSLNNNINELYRENDELMGKFQFNHDNCQNCSNRSCLPAELSNVSTPTTSYEPSANEPDVEENNDDRYENCCDPLSFFLPPTLYYSSSESASTITIQEALPPADESSSESAFETVDMSTKSTTSYVNNLKQLTKCLVDLNTNSSLILSST